MHAGFDVYFPHDVDVGALNQLEVIECLRNRKSDIEYR